MSADHEIAIDVEFDGQNLLSIALVPLSGSNSLYLVAEHGEIKDEWVRENVIPRLMTERAKYARPVPMDWIRREVAHYLRLVESATGKRPRIIADWWQDIIRLLRLIDHGDGTCEDVPDLDFSVRQKIGQPTRFPLVCMDDAELPRPGSNPILIPHNALDDAKAIALALRKEREK